MQQQFASDNYAGICPEALQALLGANHGHELAYGDDHWTQKAAELVRDLFETDCEVFFVFNGTAANSLALSSLCQSYHGVICHELAHVETDECGGPEFFSNGSKLLLGSGPNGKLTPDGIADIVTRRSDIHYPKPKVVSITQATETGTVYSAQEVAAIADQARRYSLKLHMDGAMFGFLWYNVHPAELIMGDTGSLALGSTLAVVALMTSQWVVLPIIAIIPLSEILSVVIQIAYFRYTKGKRFFKMAPIHLHFELLGWSETQVVQRFWLIGLMAAMVGVGLALV